MIRRINILLVVVLPLLLITKPCLGFVVTSKKSTTHLQHDTWLKATDNAQDEQLLIVKRAFPVLSQIQGINWEGDCRYIDGNLTPVDLPLQGGTRYDLTEEQDETDDGHWNCILTSFLVFPNGKIRQVQMQGSRKASSSSPTLRLDPVGGEGPISMLLTEVPPHTVLMNEMDRASGKIVMTSSLSLIVKEDGTCTELVQVAHEVGGDMGATKAATTIAIEGHQIWRLYPVNEFA